MNEMGHFMTWLGVLCFNCCDLINKDLFLPESFKSHHRHLYLKKKHVSQHHMNKFFLLTDFFLL